MPQSVCLVVVLAVAGLGCAPHCGNEILQEELRPGGPYRAVLFIRSCGATTGYSTHVSILGVKKLSSASTGNVLIIESGGPSDPMAKVSWLDRNTLKILHQTEQVFRKEASWNGISIVYSPL